MTGSFRASLAIQQRVVGALVLRETITRYGRLNLGFLWLFIEPMLFTLAVVAAWALLLHRQSGTIPIVEFSVTGYSTVLLWRNMASRCAHAVRPNQPLLHHRNVTTLDLFLARILLELAGATMSFMVLSTLFWMNDLMLAPADVLTVAAAWALLAWFGAGLALLIGALSSRFPIVEKLWNPFTFIFFPLSGAGFMVDWLPPGAQETVLWIPVVHGIEMLRGGYFGDAVRVHYDAGYLLAWCLGLSLLGLAQSRIVQRVNEPE